MGREQMFLSDEALKLRKEEDEARRKRAKELKDLKDAIKERHHGKGEGEAEG